MIKKQLFPKTVRFNEEARGYQITKKMDGDDKTALIVAHQAE